MQTEAATKLIHESLFCDKVFRVQLVQQVGRTPQVHIETWQIETGSTALRLRKTVKFRPYVAKAIGQALVKACDTLDAQVQA